MKIYIFPTLILFLLLAGFKGCPSKGPGGIDWSKYPNGSVRISYKTLQTTPKGAIVYSENGISQTRLSQIDEGLDGVFADATASGYMAKVGDYGFEQFFIPADGCSPSPIQGIPSFRLRADNYDGSEFDQYNPKGVGVHDGIGVIYAAEQVLSTGIYPPVGQSVICDSDIIGTAARNGVEHILAANNDPAYFDATLTHANGQGHPLLPHPISQSLASVTRPRSVNGFIRPVK